MQKKLRIIFGVLLCILIHKQGFSQTDTTSLWKKSGSVSLSFSNVGLENWAGGGDNSISSGTIIDLKAVRNTSKSTWENTFNFAYGIARVGDSQNLFKKTDDNLVIGTKYGYKLADKWSLSAGLGLRTQVAPGYTYAEDTLGKEFEDQLISKFLAPGYINANLGVTYQNKIFFVTLSPISNKLTLVMDDSLSNAGAFGVDPGSNIRSELGMNFQAGVELAPMENVNFKSNVNLFANYENLNLIDVNWETLLVFKVNKYINTSFGTQLIYDHDILIAQKDGNSKQAVQFKHVLNINVGIQF